MAILLLQIIAHHRLPEILKGQFSFQLWVAHCFICQNEDYQIHKQWDVTDYHNLQHYKDISG